MKKIAYIYGIIFTSLGILGSIPALAPNNNLFGLFSVNTMHNSMHFVTGCIAFWAGFTSENAAKIFFQLFRIAYGLIAVLGLIYGYQGIFGIFANNMADAWQHLIIAFIPSLFDYASWRKLRNLPKGDYS